MANVSPVAGGLFSLGADEALAMTHQPIEEQPQQERNVVADLETILKERDACGVSQPVVYGGSYRYERLLWIAGWLHRESEERAEPQSHRAGGRPKTTSLYT